MPRLLTLLCLFGELSVAVSDRSCRYTIISGTFNWQQGRDSCMSKGMDLAVIKDLETQNEVHNFLTTSTIGSIKDIWIGLFWSLNLSLFKWVDNETLGSWSNWNSGEPNCMELTEVEMYCPTSYDQHCVRIQLTANSWLWKTHGCYNQYYVLCQSCTAKIELPTTLHDQTSNHADLETTILPAETTGVPSTFYKQTTKHTNLETTILPSETTGIPATFYYQTTKHGDLETTILPTETTDVPATFYKQTTKHGDLETTILPTETTDVPATFYKQTTKHTNLETTILPTETTGIPATFYYQTTKHGDLETKILPTETTDVLGTFYQQTTKETNLETTILPTETTGVPATFYNQTTKHGDLETTTVPATNMSLTLTSLECEALWMNQRNCNCEEPSASPEIPNDIITYRLDKTMLSSYIRKKSSASDTRKSSFYIGCVGIIVLVLSVLFIVVLDFIPIG